MTIRKHILAAALATVTTLGMTAAGSPAQADDGRVGSFVGGAILGGIIANSGNGYYSGYYYGRPHVVVRREYYVAPDYRWRGERWRHHHRRHHDGGWDRGEGRW